MVEYCKYMHPTWICIEDFCRKDVLLFNSICVEQVFLDVDRGIKIIINISSLPNRCI